MKQVEKKNYAFIDGQNLHLGTQKIKNPWKIDYKKLRIYLQDKYKVEKAYYLLGYQIDAQNNMYQKLQEDGYIVIFKEHQSGMKTRKKGNIDTDLVFYVMVKLLDNPDDFSKIIIISGDGDFKKLIDYLIKKNRFEKILFPNRQFASSLYKSLDAKYQDSLESVKERIKYK